MQVAERILIVDDQVDVCQNVREILELDGYVVECTHSLSAARQRNDWHTFAAVLLDRVFPDGNSDVLLPQISQAAPDTPVIVITGYDDLDGAVEALRNGAADYLLKPTDSNALKATLLRVQERRKLRAKLARLAAIVESSEDAIIGTSLDGTIISWNAGATRLFDYDAADAIGRPIAIIAPDDCSREWQETLDRIQRGDRIEHFETVRMRADGSPVHVSLSVSPVRNSHGDIIGASRIFRDISKRKLLEQQLVESERMAYLGRMVPIIAHEGRNALQRISVGVEFLGMQIQDQPAVQKDLNRITAASADLHEILERIISFSAPLDLKPSNCHLPDLWRAAWSDIEHLRTGREADLREHTSGVNLRCSVDPRKFFLVFRHLFENSLLACAGPVTIGIHCSESASAEAVVLEIAVRDNGPGVPAELAAQAFEPFFTTRIHGAGLGLAIAKRIVEAHRGEIVLETAADTGAGILIKLPRDRGQTVCPKNTSE
jgi:PAS domain S-box-containing protein